MMTIVRFLYENILPENFCLTCCSPNFCLQSLTLPLFVFVLVIQAALYFYKYLNQKNETLPSYINSTQPFEGSAFQKQVQGKVQQFTEIYRGGENKNSSLEFHQRNAINSAVV